MNVAKAIVGVVLFLCVGAAGLEAGRDAVFGFRHKPPGRLIEIDGAHLHITCAGRGLPLVVFEAGAASTSANWALVQPRVAEVTRTCAYDRAGLGWSKATDRPRDGDALLGDLVALLEAAGEPGPYVMVGHSLGAVLAQRAIDTDRLDIVGLVTVDAAQPISALGDADVNYALWLDLAEQAPPWMSVFGMSRLASADIVAGYRDLPSTARAAVVHFSSDRSTILAAARELDAYFGAAWAVDVMTPDSRRASVATVVLAAGLQPRMWFATQADQAEYSTVWAREQAELAQRWPDARLVTIEGATHNSLLGVEAYAVRTAHKIIALVRHVRDARAVGD